MRVCHVIEAFGGGCAQVVVDLIHYGLCVGDNICVIYAPGRAEPKFVAQLKSFSGIKVIASAMQHKVGLQDASNALSLFFALKKAGPFDVIHAHSSKAGALLRIVGWAVPGKIVYTPHAFYSMKTGVSSIYGLIERILSWLPSTVVAVSVEEYRHAQRIGIDPSKIFLIPNGTNVSFNNSREKVRRTLDADDGNILFGFIGRFEVQKNPVRAVSAFAKIVAAFPRAHLYMIGDGKLMPHVQETIKHLKLENNIHLLGYCDARAIMPGFDCLVGSSEFEASPITFLEALSAGVPIVTTPVGGSEEAIVEGKTGFIASDFSEEALSQAIVKYLARGPQERAAMATYSLQHSKATSAETMGEKYRALYQNLISPESKIASLETSFEKL